MSEIFSHSKLNTFKNCTELYHISYIDKIRKHNENIEAFLGSCVHNVIEDIYNKKIDNINFDEMIYMYNKTWNQRWHDNIFLAQMPQYKKNPQRKTKKNEDRLSKKRSQYFQLGVTCLKNFYDKNLRGQSEIFKYTIANELNVNFEFRGVNFRGIIDRLEFNEDVNEVSILAYDALGLIYYCWSSNNKEFKTAQLYNKEGFKGLHAEFYIDENLSKQKLKIYKILNKKFVEVY